MLHARFYNTLEFANCFYCCSSHHGLNMDSMDGGTIDDVYSMCNVCVCVCLAKIIKRMSSIVCPQYACIVFLKTTTITPTTKSYMQYASKRKYTRAEELKYAEYVSFFRSYRNVTLNR